MTIKSLLFILFLCICLVWVGAAYLHPGPEFQRFGLLWTAIVLMVVLVLLLASRLFGWWRLWRSKVASRPVAPPKPETVVNEEDAALATLIAEANAALAKAPGYSGPRGKTPLSGLPLFLLIGPEGAGKTSTFLNSGVEPQLLAGQASATTAAPTQLCNLWLAKNAIFAEFSGRAFSGDLNRWSSLLGVLRGNSKVPLWRRLWKEPDAGMTLRGVVGFCDVRELSGAAADPQRLERGSRQWQERLRAIGEVFGVEFPVYQVFTKCDKIPFFPDYFGRLPESEAGQVLGCSLAFRKPDSSRAGEVFAEVEAKRLTGAFRPLYHSLAERRLSHLAHEPDPARKPKIYEFPRELKRIRSPLVQFLTDVFRPHPLRPVPLLRGFYLTAVQEVEVAAPNPGSNKEDWSNPGLGLETTRMFQADATQIFNPDATSAAAFRARKGIGTRWIFTSDLFHQVVLADRAQQTVLPKDTRLEKYRKGILATVCGVCALLCIAFVTSWAQNSRLLENVAAAGTFPLTKTGNAATRADLRALEGLRNHLEGLEDGESLSYHWGLYKGYAILEDAKSAYFRRFQQLLLNDLNELMLGRLRNLPTTPSPTDPYEPTYDFLRTHLIISSGGCPADSDFVSRTLKGVRSQAAPAADSEWQALADKQISFYANALGEGNPCRLKEDIAARDRARQYLNEIQGIDRIYRHILDEAEKTVSKPQKLGEWAPNYKQVLVSKADVSPAFTQEGWHFVQDASKKESNAAALGEACVTGNGSGLVSNLRKDAAAEGAIQQLYFRDYIAQWQAYIAGFSVVPFRSAGEAAQKLDILSEHKSPLLALLAMTANQTNFPVIAETSVMDKVPLLGNALKKGEKTAQKIAATQTDPSAKLTTADITKSFQPVHWVVPPDSDKWVAEKNSAYVAALTQLGHSMQDIAAASSPDPAIYQAATQNAAKAMEAARQIASGFRPVGVGGLDVQVERLLEEPVQYATRLIPADITKVGGDKINGELRVLCARVKNTLRKYPFQPKSLEDTSLDELSGLFAPVNGAIWKFCSGSLAELVVKEGSQWKPKDPAKKPQLTGEMLTFLNRAEAVTEAFFPAGATSPKLNYSLRPVLDAAFGGSFLELQIDGRIYQLNSALRKEFTWPPPESAKARAIAGLRAGLVFASFADRSGLWAVFRIMGDAEPRGLNSAMVEWRDSQVGAKAPIEPAPVKVEIVQFPNSADVFNPKFYDGLQCPMKAVQ